MNNNILKTRFEFTNFCMFNRVMMNEEICRGFLETILGFEISTITYRNSEQVLEYDQQSRGIRLDVVARADGKIFDVEMQTCQEPNLARRIRYYQSIIDACELRKGDGYARLPESYIIFICTQDPFGAELARYDLRTTCTTGSGVDYDDGAHAVVLNASAWERADNEGVLSLLKYIAMGECSNGLVDKIAREVECANEDSEWVRKVGVMTIEHERLVWQNAVQDAKENLEAARRELDEAIAKRDKVQSELAKVVASRESIQDELAETVARGESIQVELDKAVAIRESMQGALDEAAAKSESMQGALDEAAAKNESMQAELDEAVAQRDSVKVELDQVNARNALAAALIASGRGEEYLDAIQDKQLMDGLLKEFGIG